MRHKFSSGEKEVTGFVKTEKARAQNWRNMKSFLSFYMIRKVIIFTCSVSIFVYFRGACGEFSFPSHFKPNMVTQNFIKKDVTLAQKLAFWLENIVQENCSASNFSSLSV